MKAKLISITPDAEKAMLYMARVSNPKNQDSTNTKLLDYCIKHQHWSVFEMANMCIEIETTRGISAQILRHRSFVFQEYSQRYASVGSDGIEVYVARRQDDKNRQNSVDDLSPEIKAEWEQRQLDNWKAAFEHYSWALDNQIAKECARTVLPLGTKTRMYMNGTVRSWLHYLDLRCGNGTQKEHKDVADAIKAIFIQELPVIAKAKGWL